MEEDIPLNLEERKKKVNWLKGIPFDHFKIHHYYFNKFGKPRHGVSVEKAKQIYNQFDKIIDVFKRPAVNGFKYCFVYKTSKKSSYYLIFLLDEKPMKLLNAYFSGKNIEQRLLRKFGFR
jgi:hypothetical protein